MSRSLCFWSCFRPPRKLPQLPVLRAVVIWPEGARYAFNWWSHSRFWGKMCFHGNLALPLPTSAQP
ncbi:hypothetical protein HMPREF1545_02643 [Oscillibacter sp. KLE 1728]|nr:hypothetical protein HMPREF1545_02643 [Oscillibacter sp. KLE 1728]